MCAIFDTNIGADLVSKTPSDAASMFRKWAENHGTVAVGGKLLTELAKNRDLLNWMKRLKEAGKLLHFNDDEVSAKERQLVAGNQCTSDDPHVIALAQISGARLLYTKDQSLHQDFLNRELIDNPRGKIYQGHRHLLGRNVCKNC